MESGRSPSGVSFTRDSNNLEQKTCGNPDYPIPTSWATFILELRGINEPGTGLLAGRTGE